MILFSRKLDPIIRLKIKDKEQKSIPIIVLLKEPPSNRLKNSITKKGGKIKYQYTHINAIAAQLNPVEVDKLSELPEISFINYDRTAEICLDNMIDNLGINSGSATKFTGKNVNIAVIDTGAYLHGDLMRPFRVVTVFRDFINSCTEPYDDNGHGTQICGVIAGSGSLCESRYKGVAVNCRILMLKAFNSVGTGLFSDIIAAIDWTLENMEKYKIRILCLPFGAETIVSHKQDPLCAACKAAAQRGLVIVTAAGNKGPYPGSITTPGISPDVITVGCCNTSDSNIRKWNIADFSGRGGKIENLIKPDFIAPGVNLVSLSSDKSYIPGAGKSILTQTLDKPYCTATGTSISAAVAAGCIALLLEKIPNITLRDLRGLLKLSCQTLNEPKPSQGYGIINMKKLLSE